jgi:LiaF transmembrane domain
MSAERTLSPWPRLVVGLGVAMIGLIELLENLDLLDGHDVYPIFWPVALGALAFAFLVGRAGHPSQNWGWLFAVLAVLAALRGFDVAIPLDPFQLFWPVMLVVIGYALVRRALGGPRQRARDDGSSVSSFAMMAGLERTNRSQSFQGGDLTAVMGGVGLDLRGAKLAADGAVIDVFAMWGGIELTVPEGWRIELKVVPLLGGFEDRTRAVEAPQAPVLTVRGFVIMAGGEVHH